MELRTATTLEIHLTEEEAREALDDPGALFDEMRQALGMPEASARKSNALPPGKKAACPHCGKLCARRGLGVHIARAHGDSVTED